MACARACTYRYPLLATRIIASWYFLHQDDKSYPETNFDAFLPDNEATNSRIEVEDDHYKLVREMGAASTVLLKNVDKALPLKKPRSIVLVGSDAGPGKIGPNQFADQVSRFRTALVRLLINLFNRVEMTVY